MNSEKDGRFTKIGKTANRIMFFILAITFALLFLGAMALVVYIAPRSRPAGSAPVPVKTLAPDSLYLGAFRPVRGTSYLIAAVRKEYQSSSYSSYSSYFRYDSQGGSMHNLVFLDNDSLASRRLFNTNDFVITGINQFPEQEISQNQAAPVPVPQGTGQAQPAPEPVIPVRCLVYQVVQKDTNQDGTLTGSDLLTVAITDAGGKGYSELLTGVDQVYWIAMNHKDELLIVYQQEGVKKVSRVDINRRSVTATQTLVDLGSEVK